MIHINELEFEFGDRPLFEGVSVHIPQGHHVGIVGRNGIGKSTLFRLILRDYWTEPEMIRVRRGISIGTVAQEAPTSPEDLIQTLVATDQERSDLLAEAETADDASRIAEIHDRLRYIEAHSAEARAARILAGLGFTDEEQRKPLNSFSGGWRMRVALASTLYQMPDLLLLDEPTNYLDLEGTVWLENFLRRYPKTSLVISHDRTLLNNAVTHIMHVETDALTMYRGNYDQFEAERRNRLSHLESQRKKQAAERKHIEAFVNRFRAKASKARQAQSRLKMLERMEPLTPVSGTRQVEFDFPAPIALRSPIVKMEDVATGYDGKAVLENMTLSLRQDDRIALLGRNGNGKSTFARLLSGRLEPLEGKLEKSGRLHAGYFAQHQIDELSPDRSAYQHMRIKMPDAAEHRVRARLGGFGLTQFNMDIPADDLSGGEKSRLLFALMSFDAPQLLILDEPTNHLDIEAREALIRAINDYTGAVILISHDTHLINACVDELWIVEKRTVGRWDGSLDDYRDALLAGERETAVRDSAPAISGRGQPSKRDLRRQKAAERTLIAPLRRQLRQAEKRLQLLNEERTRIENRLARPEPYAPGEEELGKLLRTAAELNREIESQEETWLSLEEELEGAAGSED